MQTRRLTLVLGLLGATAPALLSAQDTRSEPPAWLGIRCNVMVMRNNGVTTISVGVGQVLPGTPAERGGLKPGDRIVRIDGKPIEQENCEGIARELSPGDTVRLSIRTADGTREVKLVAAARPADYFMSPSADTAFRRRMEIVIDGARLHMDTMFAGKFPRIMFSGRGMLNDSSFHIFSHMDTTTHPFFERRIAFPRMGDREVEFPRIEMYGARGVAGAELSELTPGLARLAGTTEGLLVIKVPAGTPAARAGLHDGDVLKRVNGVTVRTVEDFRAAVSDRSRQPLRLEIVRNGRTQTLELDARPVRRN